VLPSFSSSNTRDKISQVPRSRHPEPSRSACLAAKARMSESSSTSSPRMSIQYMTELGLGLCSNPRRCPISWKAVINSSWAVSSPTLPNVTEPSSTLASAISSSAVRMPSSTVMEQVLLSSRCQDMSAISDQRFSARLTCRITRGSCVENRTPSSRWRDDCKSDAFWQATAGNAANRATKRQLNPRPAHERRRMGKRVSLS